MKEIRCPHCNQLFTIDESGYQEIVSQIKEDLVDKEVHARLESMKLAEEANLAKEKATSDAALAKLQSEKDKEIASLESKLQKSEADKALAVQAAKDEANKIISDKDQEIAKLQGKIDNSETDKELAVSKATQEANELLIKKDSEIKSLQSEIVTKEKDKDIQISQLKESHLEQLKTKDEEIAYYKDLKTRLSTKMVGETLEQHCSTLFNQIRATAFPNAYFEKDNDASEGSKGDFIYRDFDVVGDTKTEFISIMFEMKNENDTTATKQKNEHFFKELDKDRNEKHCEYAVLVSLLEKDSELYDQGIVDVSYRYPKMYVIRPQFFIPLITMLRNASLNSVGYQRQLQEVKSQNIDVSNFESQLEEYKRVFGGHVKVADEKFSNAIDEIDRTISHLQKVKDALTGSLASLNKANNKLEDITIKKLTKNNPTMIEKFEAAKKPDVIDNDDIK